MPETCLKVLSFCLHLHSYKTASLSRVLIISPPFLAPPPPAKFYHPHRMTGDWKEGYQERRIQFLLKSSPFV